MPVRVIHVEAIPLGATLRQPFKFGNVVRTRSTNVLVKVTADDGHVGWGEACPVPQLTGETAASVVEAIRDRVEPALLHADPRSWRTLSTKLSEVLYGYPFTRAAVETALLDLTGRSLGLPVWAVLGGRYRSAVRVHGSVGWDEDPGTVADNARRQAEDFATLKLYAGRGDLKSDLDMLAKAREAVGDDIDFIVDVNGQWSRSQAVAASERLRELGVTILEQPLHADDLHGMRDLTRFYGERFGIAIAVDEGVRTPHDAFVSAREGSATAVTLGISKTAGPVAALDIARFVTGEGLSVLIGSVVELDVATVCGLHLAACVPQLPYASYLMGPQKYATRITDSMRVRDGHIQVPDGPGLGIDIDVDAVDAMRVTTS
jgi:L-alanine-DL-glutamate epimerase-like enolase superfamily enzyme